MSSQPKPFLSPENYLVLERAAETRLKYLDGEMFAMSGGSISHGRLISTVNANLYRQLEDTPCETMPSEVRLAALPAAAYVYLDVFVVCGGQESLDGTSDTVVNPTAVFEIFSSCTRRFDRDEKCSCYRLSATLREYVFIHADNFHAEHYVRTGEKSWILQEYPSLDDTLNLNSQI